jgi:hypothetical protein
MTTGEPGRAARDPARISVRVGDQPFPFFAEYPYFLWGEVNYDSDGDCVRPTDRNWRWLEVVHRETGERVTISRDDSAPGLYVCVADELMSARLAAYLTALRSAGHVLDGHGQREIRPEEYAPRPADRAEREQRLARAEQARAMFLNSALAPFDSMRWWAGWKWTGRIASEFALGQRLAMLAVQEGRANRRTIKELRAWWEAGPEASEREGVRAALRAATGTDPADPTTPID